MDKALQKSKAGVGWVEAWCHDPIGRAYLFLPVSPNESRLINYGKEHREGQSHLHGQVESTVDQLVGFRMEKKQHMRWSQRGAQILLHACCALLKGELGKYTGSLPTETSAEAVAACTPRFFPLTTLSATDLWNTAVSTFYVQRDR